MWPDWHQPDATFVSITDSKAGSPACFDADLLVEPKVVTRNLFSFYFSRVLGLRPSKLNFCSRKTTTFRHRRSPAFWCDRGFVKPMVFFATASWWFKLYRSPFFTLLRISHLEFLTRRCAYGRPPHLWLAVAASRAALSAQWRNMTTWTIITSR